MNSGIKSSVAHKLLIISNINPFNNKSEATTLIKLWKQKANRTVKNNAKKKNLMYMALQMEKETRTKRTQSVPYMFWTYLKS